MKKLIESIKTTPVSRTMTLGQITEDFFKDMQEDIAQELNRLMFANHVKPSDNAKVTLLLRQACVNVALSYQPKKPAGSRHLKLVA